MTFLVLDLVLIFVNALCIMHILSSTRLIISCIVKLCEFCQCTYSGVFKVAFCTNENTVNNNNDDYLKAKNNPNTSQSSSANTNINNINNNNSNNNKNNGKDIHRKSVCRDTTILISNASVNDKKRRKHLSSNGVTSVTGTSATTIATDGNCINTSSNSSINTINDNINDTNIGSDILTKMGCLASTSKTVNLHLNLNNYKSNTQSELGVSSFVAATLVVSALTLGCYCNTSWCSQW